MVQVYVGNIPVETHEDEIRDLFAPFGAVASVTFVRDRETGAFRGFGFVEMLSEEAAHRAIEALENTGFRGQTLRVNEARPRQPRPPRDTW